MQVGEFTNLRQPAACPIPGGRQRRNGQPRSPLGRGPMPSPLGALPNLILPRRLPPLGQPLFMDWDSTCPQKVPELSGEPD